MLGSRITGPSLAHAFGALKPRFPRARPTGRGARGRPRYPGSGPQARTILHPNLGEPLNRPTLVLAFALAASLAPRVAPAQQEPDTAFDTRIARPAFVKRHPRVAVDEAHHNFHTMSGRYAPLAALIRSDGCEVVPGRTKFSAESLRGLDVLVISNALGHAKMDHEEASNPAFTPEECAAVRA